MGDKQQLEAPMKMSMNQQWTKGAEYFEEICGKSLLNGEIKSFDDIEKHIENMKDATTGGDKNQEQIKWEKMKSVGLMSLRCIKMLLKTVSDVSSFVPIPEAAANITISALNFVFNIPEIIINYRDAINNVFDEVSSALSQFRIYDTIDNINPFLANQIHLVLISVVKVCAHVVNYRQGRKLERFRQHFKSSFGDSELDERMRDFKQALQQQRDIEGTVTLAVAIESYQSILLLEKRSIVVEKAAKESLSVAREAYHGVALLQNQSIIVGETVEEALLLGQETRHDIALLKEKSTIVGETTKNTLVVVRETHQDVQEMQKGVQVFINDKDRMKSLIKIRDALGVDSTVRLDTNTTQTCTDIASKCLGDTGSWIWKHEAYVAWTSPKEDKKDEALFLVVQGPPSSGKTSVNARIIKCLEQQQGRVYVAHYFFPSGATKFDNEKDLIHTALKYMAFQIARVDVTLQKVLGKACDEDLSAIHCPASYSDLWKKLKFGASGSSTLYYLVFDGIENLSSQQANMLLEFIFSLQSAGKSSERVRVLVSGTDNQFQQWIAAKNTYFIKMNDYNKLDMRKIIEKALSQRGILQDAEPGSRLQKARSDILEKLPNNVEGSYSQLKFGLDDVIHLLSKRCEAKDLNKMLDRSMSSHEAAIENLQRSSTAKEINELNELLKWVFFSRDCMTLDQLEAAMFLYSGVRSLTSLQYVIENKYFSVLEIHDSYVYGQEGVKDYLQGARDSSSQQLSSKSHATISMTITIQNVDHETCGNLLWDLAHKAIRDKFNFNVDGDASNALRSSSWGTIAVNEFEAHHTILTRVFDYLNKRSVGDEIKEIGKYLVSRLPYHLNCLLHLGEKNKGQLMPMQYFEIGKNLYEIFSSDEIFIRHKESFGQTWWTVEEMESVKKWLMDSSVVLRLPDREWRNEVQEATSPARGYLKHFTRTLINKFLRERTWNVVCACKWIEQLIEADEKSFKQNIFFTISINDKIYSKDTDWNYMSIWCAKFLGLQDSELDSLWYERLAEASQHESLDAAISLYERAIQKHNPSWQCYRGLGITYYNNGQIQNARGQLLLAYQRMEQEDAQPKPEAKDIVELQLLLGQYAYEAADMETAKKYYSLAEMAGQGGTGYIKVMLNSSDVDAIEKFLDNRFKDSDQKVEIGVALRDIAQDSQHEFLVSRMLTAASRDSNLLKRIASALQMAVKALKPNKRHPHKASEGDSRYTQDEVCGVLLCDQGFAEYLYGVSENSPGAIKNALRLWMESRDQLSDIGGSKALFTRRRATTAVANHYFQSIIDNMESDQDRSAALGKLAALAESDPDYNFYHFFHNHSRSLLTAALVLRKQVPLAREMLVKHVRQALQILSDDIPENDVSGFQFILSASSRCNDLMNAAIALSLYGQPDFVTETLGFDIGDVNEGSIEDKKHILATVVKLAKETIQVVKAQVPDITKQIQRIEVAIAHINSLTAATKDKVRPVDDGGKDMRSALRLLDSRLPRLSKELRNGLRQTWECGGFVPDGKACGKSDSFKADFYYCIYCPNQSFCGDCHKRLLDPSCNMGITVCSAKHKWLYIPKQEDGMYVGPTAKKVRVPSDVRAEDDDNRILKVYYAEDCREEMTVDAWKESLRKTWDIPWGST